MPLTPAYHVSQTERAVEAFETSLKEMEEEHAKELKALVDKLKEEEKELERDYWISKFTLLRKSHVPLVILHFVLSLLPDSHSHSHSHSFSPHSSTPSSLSIPSLPHYQRRMPFNSFIKVLIWRNKC